MAVLMLKGAVSSPILRRMSAFVSRCRHSQPFVLLTSGGSIGEGGHQGIR